MKTENVFESARFAEGDLVEVLDTPNVRLFTEKAIGHRMTLTRTNAKQLNAEGITTEGEGGGYGQKYPVNYLSNDLRIIARASERQKGEPPSTTTILPPSGFARTKPPTKPWCESWYERTQAQEKARFDQELLFKAGVRDDALGTLIKKDDPLEKYLLDPKPFRSSKRKTKGKLITI